MATAAMALSVYKRFQAFPCIIQNNPLRFSRKADPKIGTQSKIISAPQTEVSDQHCRFYLKYENAHMGKKSEETLWFFKMALCFVPFRAISCLSVLIGFKSAEAAK